MPCLLIYGDTGMGKTKIVRKFERAHPATLCQSTGVTNRPVVVAQVPSEPVERDLYRELLASPQAPALVGGTLAREKDICRSLLRTAGARMIVLDEVNGMLAGTYRQQRIFLNALRFSQTTRECRLFAPVPTWRARPCSPTRSSPSASRRFISSPGRTITPLRGS